MRGRLSWKVKSVGVHLILWGMLVVWSYSAAGPFQFASCWSIALIYPPFALLGAVTGLASVSIVIMSIGRPQLSSSMLFLAAYHGLILIGGMLAARLAAHVSVGPVSCL